MTYVDGFVLAVPAENKEAFREHASQLQPLFRECGIARVVECWGDDVPDGKLTDFKGAVQAKEGEVVVFAWFEYPSREARDAATAKMRSDPRMGEHAPPAPFDAGRMILGGFASIVDERGEGESGYVDGFVLPVPEGKRGAYLEMAEKAAAIFREYGAVRVVEGWGDDVPDGKVTDYRRAVKAEDGENVVYSWIEWPSRAVRDEAWAKVMADPRMQPDHANMPFDGKRMFWGGFVPLIDSNR
ncbi:MAG: DUF1428 domain-containing protein [Sphingomonadaceae bacterium]|nr:DUF1428 domain-containing protein [Sphingomonadaceae bacterium]